MNSCIDLCIEQIKEKIVDLSKQQIRLDIDEGKMGFCLYFYKLARLLNEPLYKKQAEKLLDDIYMELSNTSMLNTTYEIAQIGIGIEYLIKHKYVSGNINSILYDIDSLIFKTIIFEKKPTTYRTNGVFIILYYICIRIEQQHLGSDARFMLEELCIKLFNELYISLDSAFYDETYLFNLSNYKLPQFLYVVSKIYLLQFYNYRIIETIQEIAGFIKSRIPVLHSNRLYLLWGLLHLKKVTELDIWDEQIDMLASKVNCQKMIYKELRSKDVFIQDGVAGIYLLLTALKDTPHPIPFDKALFLKRIEESAIWKDKEAFETLGFINGFSGFLWVCLELKASNNADERNLYLNIS